MQKEIRASIDVAVEKPQRPWRVKVPKEPVPESAKWHMQHRPYHGGGDANGKRNQGGE